MAAALAANRMGYGGAFREKGICETPSFERVIALKRGMEAELVLSIFPDDNSCLVVSDFDDVRFGHGSCVAGTEPGILCVRIVQIEKYLNGACRFSGHKSNTLAFDRSRSASGRRFQELSDLS